MQELEDSQGIDWLVDGICDRAEKATKENPSPKLDDVEREGTDVIDEKNDLLPGGSDDGSVSMKRGLPKSSVVGDSQQGKTISCEIILAV